MAAARRRQGRRLTQPAIDHLKLPITLDNHTINPIAARAGDDDSDDPTTALFHAESP